MKKLKCLPWPLRIAALPVVGLLMVAYGFWGFLAGLGGQ